MTALLSVTLSLHLPAASTHSDDSCDIATLPAATLLLPYFEVDLNAPQSVARTTLFTVTNTSNKQVVARATIWTDLGYPLLAFNLSLTGYDVQPVNLYDILARGILPEPGCLLQTPSPIPPQTLTDIRTALTTGAISTCEGKVGLAHPNADGYITIDLVGACDSKMPTDAGYFAQLLFDNVLTGDYETIDPNAATGNYAGGTPLVHIRAIPEGGTAGQFVPTNLPYTFYDHYTPAETRAIDRRQPLPSLFAARYIQGGRGAFTTEFRIWREGVVPPDAACGDYKDNGLIGTKMKITDEVRFDEHENPTIAMRFGGPPPVQPLVVVLPPTASVPTSSGIFPPLSASGDIGGWLYFNLNNGASSARPSQNWVSVAMSAEGRYQTVFDATMLSNGCNAAP